MARNNHGRLSCYCRSSTRNACSTPWARGIPCSRRKNMLAMRLARTPSFSPTCILCMTFWLCLFTRRSRKTVNPSSSLQCALATWLERLRKTKTFSHTWISSHRKKISNWNPKSTMTGLFGTLLPHFLIKTCSHVTNVSACSSVLYTNPPATHLHKSMLLRGVIEPARQLDNSDIAILKSKARHSGRDFGGAPLYDNTRQHPQDRNDNGRGSRISYAADRAPPGMAPAGADNRSNPFAAFLDPRFAPVAGRPSPPPTKKYCGRRR